MALTRIGDRRVAVSGGMDGTLRRWDLATGESVGEPLVAHAYGVFAVAVGKAGGHSIGVSAGKGLFTVEGVERVGASIAG